jgi:hypothetical protein
MKTLLKLFVFASVIVLIAISCQKLLSNEDLSATIFNTTAAKNWYYGTFIKSPEWSGSAQREKQLPDWKNGVVATIEKQDAVVYPFIKGSRSFLIPEDKSLSAPQCKRIADASLSKIAFIKTADNQITVKEIDYIPDWQYLQNKHFNIGEMKGANGKSDFSGSIITKDWTGNILSIQIQVDGKTVKIGKRVNDKKTINGSKGENNTSSLEGCTYTEFCLWQQDCVITIYGDGMITNECGEWYIVECWLVENCPDPPPPPPPPPICDPTLVSPEEEEYNNYVLMGSGSPVTVDANTTTEGPNPISGVHIWTVASGSIANWQIKANTNYSYIHDKYFDINLNAFVHTYNLFNYQTVSSYYIGSNTFITSTWTQTSVLDQVLDNNTSNTHGTSVVHGTIRHVANIPLNIPYCPRFLDQTFPINPNTLIFNPR